MNDEMNSVKMYEQEYWDFCKRHGGGINEQSTLIDNVTHKTIRFEDGSTWYEVSSFQIFTLEEALAKNLYADSADFVPIYKTEYWTSDNSKSSYRYEVRELTPRERIENIIPEGLTECLIFVNDTKEVLSISIGAGDNLLQGALDEGYVDYLDVYGSQYVGFSETDAGFKASDGDMYMTKESICDIRSVIYDFLIYRYGNCPKFVILDTEV